MMAHFGWDDYVAATTGLVLLIWFVICPWVKKRRGL